MAPSTGVSVSFSPLSIRMLVFDGTLLIVFKFGSIAINEFHHIRQPSKLVHFSDDSDEDIVDGNGEGNNFTSFY